MIHLMIHYYKSSQKFIGFGLVAFIAVSDLIPVSNVRVAAIGLLGAIILEILFEIHHAVNDKPTTWYSSFNEGAIEMVKDAEARLAKNGHVELRWIGVTMEAGWPICQGLVSRSLRSRRQSIDIRLAVLDPNWPDAHILSAKILATVDAARHFVSSRGAELTSRGGRIAFHTYAHRPTWHALLIDSDILYFSPSIPGDYALAGPQAGIEKLVLHDGDHVREKILYVEAWFAEISDSATPLFESS